MFERRIQVEPGAHLTLVEMVSDVTLAAWDGDDVLVRLRTGAEEGLSIEQTEAGPAISANEGCEVYVPAWMLVAVREVAGNLKATGLAALNAEQVRGNLKIAEVEEVILAEVYGNLKADGTQSLRLVGTVYSNATFEGVQNADLQNVRGNLRAQAMDQCRVSRIGGNLQVKECRGALSADRVGGNALLIGVAGVLSLNQVAGNLVAKNLVGGARVGRIGGNLVLNSGLGSGCTYHFQSDGNATLRLSEGANAHVTLLAEGRLVTSSALAIEEQDGSRLTGTVGEGGAELVVEAKGNVVLGSAQPSVGANLGDEISRQVEESLSAIDFEAIGRQVSEEMEASMSRLRVKLEGVDWERLGSQAQHAVERAMGQIQRDVDRMADRAAKQQVRWERKEERRVHRQRQRQSADAVFQPVEEDAEPEHPEWDVEEERLSILRMVEQGQISPEEAEMLLDALS
jgi:hypothetical protein